MKFLDIVIAEESSLKEKEERAGTQDHELAPTLEKLGYAYHALNRFHDAQESYERALRIRLAAGQGDTAELIPCIHALGLMHRLQGNYPAAEMHYKHALQLAERLSGENAMDTCIRRNYLAGLYYAMKRYEEAQELIMRSADIYASQLGGAHSAVTLCLLAQALIAFRTGQKAKGEKLINQVTATMQENVDFKEVAGEANDEILKFVLLQLRQEKLEDAEALFRFALVREANILWPNHPLVAKNLRRLGDLNRSMNHLERAAELYRQSLEMYMSTMGIADPEIATLAESFGQVLIQLNKRKEAVWPMKVAVDVREMFQEIEPEQYEKAKNTLDKLNSSL
ncbi:MAG TPA: tetratricopeptide repeat protein [Candidatus Melainabacteria bacterium]|jgi:tetratricopeptide (TPR) repeat protein|nr:tetratricopeptide repeat protein [Candidatus Melainabacteria bacterium]HIN64040.1 tetratricopeptide repeat protein [Candidatus Obscuribacterales bacterium]